MRRDRNEQEPLDDEESEDRILRDAEAGRSPTHKPQLGLLAAVAVAVVVLTGLMWCVK